MICIFDLILLCINFLFIKPTLVDQVSGFYAFFNGELELRQGDLLKPKYALVLNLVLVFSSDPLLNIFKQNPRNLDLHFLKPFQGVSHPLFLISLLNF